MINDKTSLEKGIQRALDIGPESTYKQILRNPTFLKLLKDTYTLLGRESVIRTLKEADASLSDDDLAQVADSVISQIFHSVSQGNAYGSWRPESQDISPVLQQMSAPSGGTENLSNVASPGAKPAKIAADPGKSGTNTTGSYRTKDEVENNYTPGTYSGTAYSNAGIAGQRSPDPRLTTRQTRDNLADQVGPVGTRGGTSHIPSTTRQQPGEVAFNDNRSQYKHWTHSDENLPKGIPFLKILTPVSAPSRNYRYEFGMASNEAIDEANGKDKFTKAGTAQKLVKAIADSREQPVKLTLSKRRYKDEDEAREEANRLLPLKEEGAEYGADAGTPPPTEVAGTDDGSPTGWAQNSDQATEWDNSAESSNRAISIDDADMLLSEEEDDSPRIGTGSKRSTRHTETWVEEDSPQESDEDETKKSVAYFRKSAATAKRNQLKK